MQILNHSQYLAHTEPLFYQDNTLKLCDLCRFQSGIFMYQQTKNELPNCLLSLFEKNTVFYSHSTRQTYKFHVPFTRTQLAQKIIKFERPKLWNSLDKSLQGQKTVSSFKTKDKKIKT